MGSQCQKETQQPQPYLQHEAPFVQREGSSSYVTGAPPTPGVHLIQSNTTLHQASLEDDSFFLYLHQLLFSWLLEAENAYKVFPSLCQQTINNTFEILLSILYPQLQHIRIDDLRVLATFAPHIISLQQHSKLMVRISNFIVVFHEKWDTLLSDSKHRSFPLVAAELGPALECGSGPLGITLFAEVQKQRAARRPTHIDVVNAPTTTSRVTIGPKLPNYISPIIRRKANQTPATSTWRRGANHAQVEWAPVPRASSPSVHDKGHNLHRTVGNDAIPPHSADRMQQLDNVKRRPVLTEQEKHVPPYTQSPNPQHLYQYVNGFAVGPTDLRLQPGPHSFLFTITDQDRIFPGCVGRSGSSMRLATPRWPRYRLRICKRHESHESHKRHQRHGRHEAAEPAEPPSESEWVVSATDGPPIVDFTLNGTAIRIGRKHEFGPDLPVDISHLLARGENEMQIALSTDHERAAGGIKYLVAVEIIHTALHEDIVNTITNAPLRDTVQKIQDRLRPVISDDVVVTSRTLRIDMTDPFSKSTPRTPVRGMTCEHLECFDLEIWLQSRRIQQEKVSLVDCWKCPLCDGDARPNRLYIDRFFADVLNRAHPDTKKIEFMADGSWTEIKECDSKSGSRLSSKNSDFITISDD